jgi:uncharacterized membrane protein YphA (DoxX/SURF4 family)
MHSVLVGVSRIAVALLFLASGIAKFRFFNQFTRSLHSYGWIRGSSKLRKLAFLIGAVEVLTGFGLCVFYFARIASIMGLVLFAIFTCAVVAALMKPNRPARCGCMVLGTNDRLGWNVVLRNLAFMFLLLPSVSRLPLAASCLGSAAFLFGAFALTDAEGERARSRMKAETPTPNEA